MLRCHSRISSFVHCPSKRDSLSPMQGRPGDDTEHSNSDNPHRLHREPEDHTCTSVHFQRMGAGPLAVSNTIWIIARRKGDTAVILLDAYPRQTCERTVEAVPPSASLQ